MPFNDQNFGPEQQKAQFEFAVAQGVEKAKQILKERFEQDRQNPENNLDFHNVNHTEGVIDRTVRVLRAIQKVAPELVSDHEVEIGQLAAAFHDTVQDYDPNPVDQDGKIKIMRKRHIGKNEEASAAEMEKFIADENEQSEIFSAEDIKLAHEALMVTVPGFNPDLGTVVQPNLTPDSHVVVRALALADIGTPGMDGPEKFIPEGDNLFCEENLDIRRALQGDERLSDDQKEFFRSRMIGWTKGQLKFAEGRKTLLEQELGNLPEKAKSAVRALFDKFDQTIEAQNQEIARCEKMSFEQLAKEMGY